MTTKKTKITAESLACAIAADPQDTPSEVAAKVMLSHALELHCGATTAAFEHARSLSAVGTSAYLASIDAIEAGAVSRADAIARFNRLLTAAA